MLVSKDAAMTQIVAKTSMTTSLHGLSFQNLRRVPPASDLALHFHYFKSRLKRTPKTTVCLMHPNQTSARLCC
jgi:hypothetical protein